MLMKREKRSNGGIPDESSRERKEEEKSIKNPKDQYDDDGKVIVSSATIQKWYKTGARVEQIA
ncbi:hypothetical protein BGAL_0400g00020 [Botrytis galanthina]|uniref:Uncharacterized protein n=1 Tax=Botrytis galanthina TaxID=278940 RepID=A0A4S8QZK1_9HELO|nr:hypothetical protein BGAL_0400g00020 [Botrytis galanthina]